MHRIHVCQDQVTHMHQLSEHQKQCQKLIESIKTLLHDQMSHNRNKLVLAVEKDVSIGS
jgi:hypothetical protein